jgi:hypothetical protein
MVVFITPSGSEFSQRWDLEFDPSIGGNSISAGDLREAAPESSHFIVGPCNADRAVADFARKASMFCRSADVPQDKSCGMN